MKKYHRLNKETLSDFPLKEQKNALAVEPDLLFDFYLFPKVFIIDDIKNQLSELLTGVIVQDGAVELKQQDLRNNFSYLYIDTIFNADNAPENIHFFRSEDNQTIYISDDVMQKLNSLNLDSVWFRNV